MSAITWTNLTNASVATTTLSKSSGADGIPNAGATSTQSLSADGTVSVTIPATTAELFVGFSASGAFTTDPTQITHGIHIYPTASWDAREANVYRTEGTYNAGDVFQFARTGTTVVLKQNGVTKLTFPTASSGTVYVDAFFWTLGGAITSGDLTDLSGGGGGGSSIPTLASASPTTQISAPTSYSGADTTNTVYLDALHGGTLPTLPSSVNGTYTDPKFNRTIRRMTNASTGANANVSHRCPSSEQVCAWRRDSNGFFTVNPFGASEYHTFDQATGHATYVRTTTFGQEPTFSRVTANILYGTSGYKVRKHDVDANTYTDLIDLAVIDPTYTGGSLALGGSVQSSASNPERLVFFYGGTSQDTHFRVCVFDVTNTANRLVLDTQAKTINGVAVPMDHAFHIHAIGMDQGGNYVIVYPTGPDQSAGAAPAYFWDLVNGTVTANITAWFPWGHDSSGYGVYFNNTGDLGSPYDAFEFAYRPMSNLSAYTKVINPQLTPQLVNMDTHPNWNNARSDAVTPIVVGTYLFYENIAANLYTIKSNTVAFRACDNEIVSVHPVTGTRYRWAHTQSNTYSDDGSGAGIGFWYEPIPQISPNGRWILFASNMQKTLGTDADGDASTVYRTDTWLIDTQENTSGPATVTVPDVTGLTQAAAGTALLAMGLAVGTVTTANSDTVPVGLVISQLPTAGSTANVGDAVALTVSLGPLPVVTHPPVDGSVSHTAITVTDIITKRSHRSAKLVKGQ